MRQQHGEVLVEAAGGAAKLNNVPGPEEVRTGRCERLSTCWRVMGKAARAAGPAGALACLPMRGGGVITHSHLASLSDSNASMKKSYVSYARKCSALVSKCLYIWVAGAKLGHLKVSGGVAGARRAKV